MHIFFLLIESLLKMNSAMLGHNLFTIYHSHLHYFTCYIKSTFCHSVTVIS